MVLNPKTELQLAAFLKHPTHAVAVAGPTGSGKSEFAQQLAAMLLELPVEKLTAHAYFRRFVPEKQVITIEMAREIAQYMRLKTTGGAKVRRVVIVEDAHNMTTEAQNALLKILEEPPADSVLILTLRSINSVLPTISSRLQAIAIYPVAEDKVTEHFVSLGHDEVTVKKYYLMSGGLPGLMHAMLESDDAHPLVEAIAQAKTILQADTFTRLTMVDDIAKQKQFDDLFFALKQTAQVALKANAAQQGRESATKKWTLVLAKVHEAQDMLGKNAQPKLVLTDLFLGL